ncbi:MAG: hypothetical protein ACKONH_00375 [Planctomycetia bacterium]
MRQFLNRRFAAAVLTVVALAAFSAPAFAGGGGGGSKSKVNVRVKNFTLNPVAVAVANKNASAFRGLNPDQVTQFKVNKGTFVVKDPRESASFNTGSRKTVYIAITEIGIEDTTTRF